MKSGMMTGDWGNVYRIDTVRVPAVTRDEFLDRVRATSALLERLPGFVQHLVFEETSRRGESSFVTITVWESAEAIDAARRVVATRHGELGFTSAELNALVGSHADAGHYARM